MPHHGLLVHTAFYDVGRAPVCDGFPGCLTHTLQWESG